MSAFRQRLKAKTSSLAATVKIASVTSSTAMEIPNEIKLLLDSPILTLENCSVVVEGGSSSSSSNNNNNNIKNNTVSKAAFILKRRVSTLIKQAKITATSEAQHILKLLPFYLVFIDANTNSVTSYHAITSLTSVAILKEGSLFSITFKDSQVTMKVDEETKKLKDAINSMINDCRLRTSMSDIEIIRIAGDVNVEKITDKFGSSVEERLSELMSKQNVSASETLEIKDLMNSLRKPQSLGGSSSNLIDIDDAQMLSKVDGEHLLEARLDAKILQSDVSSISNPGVIRESNSVRLEGLMKKKMLTKEEAEEIKGLMRKKMLIMNQINNSGAGEGERFLESDLIGAGGVRDRDSNSTSKTNSTRSKLISLKEAQKDIGGANLENLNESAMEAALDDLILNQHISKPKNVGSLK